ncbi:50S ribosomal protein L3 [Stomatohabitans albus]|uniref:50S ribosomal protein L3 n=1 Tax=Stomatohabitans albus TaxID=3110766 RepID=UPI00300C9F37
MTNKAILGTKLGMTQIFDADGRVVPVTVVNAGPCPVVQVRTVEQDGYDAVQLGWGTIKPKRVAKPQLGEFKKAGVEPTRRLVEVRMSGEFEPGQTITVDQFATGEFVDVTGVSKGKGFAGTMKRHNFAGQRASHGAHKVHRAPGSVGAAATPARVFPGTRMAGRMGNRRVTTLNLELAGVDTERNLLLIKGSVPGPNGAMVTIRNAVKKTQGGEA